MDTEVLYSPPSSRTREEDQMTRWWWGGPGDWRPGLVVAYAEQKWPITITTAITIKQSSYLTRVILLNKDLKCMMYSIVSGCNYSGWNNNAWFKIKNLMSSIHLPVDPSHVFLWRRLFESCLILTFCKFLLYLISNKRIKSIKRKIWVAVITIERRKRERGPGRQ